jgi:3-deoxy-D-manno-octulosonate 8-phosphate phosphatase (KDO 8-P phosphatase)
MNVLANFKLIKAFVLDVDGVLTDGSLILLNDGQMARTMNIKDGYALQLAVKKGYHILIISGGTSDAVKIRLEKLGISNVHMSVKDKQQVLKAFVAEHQLDWSQVLYIGDDVPDVAPMKLAGLPCCPADAATEVKNISQYISPINGGKGCVREIIEKVLLLNEDWNDNSLTASV